MIPFRAHFMPLVPLASRGRIGVLSHRSTPWVIREAISIL